MSSLWFREPLSVGSSGGRNAFTCLAAARQYVAVGCVDPVCARASPPAPR